MEHQRYLESGEGENHLPGDERESSSTYKPFANLKDLLKDKK
jgi:hypothetical protein